jgi:tRNA(adenine34) deaminase
MMIDMGEEQFMKLALREAEKAYAEGEVPVGAIVVINNRVISRGYNMVEKLKDPTAHAEIIALTSAFNSLGSKYLQDATLYVTVEPCLMCAGALHWSKIGKIVWGAEDVKNGHQVYTENRNPFHPKTQILTGLMADEAASLMKAFFQEKRKKS